MGIGETHNESLSTERTIGDGAAAACPELAGGDICTEMLFPAVNGLYASKLLHYLTGIHFNIFPGVPCVSVPWEKLETATGWTLQGDSCCHKIEDSHIVISRKIRELLSRRSKEVWCLEPSTCTKPVRVL